MLQVILGHANLALREKSLATQIQKNLTEIEKAAQRSSILTKQLLGFARKQTIRPKVMNLNDSIPNIISMLRRLVGEDMELAWFPGNALGKIKMDSSQVDQILANLVVNARDAISGTGRITIETLNMVFDQIACTEHPEYVPGDYVMLAVSDNGSGMDKETLSRIFEPFYTTKGIGKGTGLGLATVYGIVKQNNGFINVYSEPGQGTTFKIYFPRTTEDLDLEEESRNKVVTGGSETILLVEDEEALLMLGKAFLEQLGYNVLAADDPETACRIARENAGKVDLLITDVVMPSMNGKQLFEKIKTICPAIRSIYMSGYTANVIAHRGVLEKDVVFIQKPFTLHEIADKIREALERK